jgi:hypothetical protein
VTQITGIKREQQVEEKLFAPFTGIAQKCLIDIYSKRLISPHSPVLMAACATQIAFTVLGKLKMPVQSKMKYETGDLFGAKVGSHNFAGLQTLCQSEYLPKNWLKLFDESLTSEKVAELINEVLI